MTVSWKPQIFEDCFNSRFCALWMDLSVSICFPRIMYSSSFDKFIFFFIISPDGLTTFVISISSSALCIGHSFCGTTSKSGLFATFLSSLPCSSKKQGFLLGCYLFRNFECLFCFRLNIYRPQQPLLLYCHSHSTSKVIFF